MPGQTEDSVSLVSPARSRIGTTYADKRDGDPASILTPLDQGDGRDVLKAPSTFDRLLALPDTLLDLGPMLTDIRNVVTEALQRELWVNDASLSNVAGTTATVGGVAVAYGTGFPAQMGYAVVLRHLQVGSDTAGVVTLYASKSTVFIGGIERNLGAVRLTTQCPTVFPAITPILSPEENLLVVLTAASGKLDFSCEYLSLRSGR